MASAGPKSGNPASIAKVLAGLAIVVFVHLFWLGWILSEPFPNVEINKKVPVPGQPPQAKMNRSVLLWRAFPEVVPGVSYRESYIGLALGELSELRYLPQRIPIVLAAGFILVAVNSLGLSTIRLLGLGKALNIHERIPLAFGVGVAGIGILTLICGRLGLIGPWPVRVGLLFVIATGLPEFYALWRERGDFFRVSPFNMQGYVLASTIAAPFLGLMALAAMLPTTDFDGLEYHLQGPKEYYQAGAISFLPHNVYTSMPFSIEMLHLLGMEVLDDWWTGALVGQLLIMVHAVFAAGCIALAAGRWGSPRAALVGFLVYLSTPWIYRLGAMPYVEGPLCYVHAALVYAAAWSWNCDRELKSRGWALVGLLAGGAMAIKYPSVVTAVIPFGFVALLDSNRNRSWKGVAAFVLGVGVIMTPWLAKNVIDTGNPVYPLANGVFGGRFWSAELDTKWSAAHGSALGGYKTLSFGEFFGSIIDVAGRSDWQSPLYLMLAPLALLRRDSRREAIALSAFVAYLFLTWWLVTHRLDRFWIPLLAPLAILAGLGADWVKHIAWSVWLWFVLGLIIVVNLVYDTTGLAALNEWTADLTTVRKTVRERIDMPLYKLDQMMGQGDISMVVGQAAVFPMEHTVRYSVVFSPEIFEQYTREKSNEDILKSFKDANIGRIYVDWSTIERFQSPGNYGWTSYTSPQRFKEFVERGVLLPPIQVGQKHEVYPVAAQVKK